MMRRVENDARRWVYGMCFPMAVALHAATGWRIGTLSADRGKAGRGLQTAHAWVIDPEGGMWDAAGRITTDDVADDYLSTETEECRAGARWDEFSDIDGYYAFVREVEGEHADRAIGFIDQVAPEADAFVRGVLSGRFPEIAEALLEREPTCPEP